MATYFGMPFYGKKNGKKNGILENGKKNGSLENGNKIVKKNGNKNGTIENGKKNGKKNGTLQNGNKKWHKKNNAKFGYSFRELYNSHLIIPAYTCFTRLERTILNRHIECNFEI